MRKEIDITKPTSRKCSCSCINLYELWDICDCDCWCKLHRYREVKPTEKMKKEIERKQLFIQKKKDKEMEQDFNLWLTKN